MIAVRPAAERGHEDHGWLDTYHTFSFADYYDPRQMQFRSLRVINEDRVQPGQGFPPHSHRNMEIISYVLEGGLAHKDSTGTAEVLYPGEVQRMSAGRGMTHSEYNASASEGLHFLQIWLLPNEQSLPPSYEQKEFPAAEREGKLRLVASPDAAAGSLLIHQDALLYTTNLKAGEQVSHQLAEGRAAWVQVARGSVQLDELTLQAGDGAAVTEASSLTLTGLAAAEVLLFDLA